MTDQIQFPPLHHPAPGEIERRRQHLLSEIGRQSERSRISPPFSLRRRWLAGSVAVGAAAVAAISLALVSTGGSPPQRSTSREARFNPGGTLMPGNAAIDWAHPGGPAAQSVSSAADAASDLNFKPVTPSELGTPTALVVEPAAGNEPLTNTDAQLTMAYNNPSGGMFWLVERASGATTTDILSGYAQECADPAAGCYGTWTIYALHNGNHGLLIEGPAGSTTAVVWVEGGVYFNAVGPADSFTVAQAAAVANSVIDG